MTKKEIRQLLDLIQVIADDPKTPQTEQRELLMLFGYYTAYLEHSIKLDMFDKRKLNQLKRRYCEQNNLHIAT